MHKSRIIVDLPSAETDRRKGPIEWVRTLFGAQLDLRSGKEELTVTAFSLVEGLVEAFASVGVHDAISFIVDKKVVYLDTAHVADDLPEIARAAHAAGILDKKFHEMHLVLSHESSTLHTILDCAITNGVMLGEAEMTITLSSRLPGLQIQQGETAQQYADRVKAFAAKEQSFEPSRLELDALTQKITDELSSALPGARVTRETAVVQLVRPDARQIGRFRKLGFGSSVQSPTYRAVPTTQRHGVYVDPFYYYYYDPYYDYMNYWLVSSMIHDSMWHSHHVHVVDPTGSQLFTGGAVPAASTGSSDDWIGNSAVDFDDSGEVKLSPSVAAEAPESDNSSWWGGSSDDDSSRNSPSIDSSSYDSSSSESSSSSSASSCGSSCSSSSSCGSSCSSSSD